MTIWKPTCNRSVSVQLSSQRTTSDGGALLLREALDSSGVINALEEQLIDPRDPSRVQHSLVSQVRAIVLQRAVGWNDLTDTLFCRTIHCGDWLAVMRAAPLHWRSGDLRSQRCHAQLTYLAQMKIEMPCMKACCNWPCGG